MNISLQELILMPISSATYRVDRPQKRCLPDPASQYHIPSLKSASLISLNLSINFLKLRLFSNETILVLQVVQIQCLIGRTSLVKRETVLCMDSESMVSRFNFTLFIFYLFQSLLCCLLGSLSVWISFISSSLLF